MANKRSREKYEANLQVEQSPFAIFGTPLPPQDPDIRDDGSYLPVWKQEVRDERGLKRLHGAFTGGFSAGYFNTVGSKEGWTPSNFSSSRSNRHNGTSKAIQQRPEDFMDEEDIRDAEEAQRVETATGFSGLGSTVEDVARKVSLIDIFRVDGETIGVKLLKKMGWKEGQGIGPKVRRTARLGGHENPDQDQEPTYLFAPKNSNMVKYVKKNDYKGIGFQGGAKLQSHHNPGSDHAQHSQDENELWTPLKTLKTHKKDYTRSGLGVGILNDTGSDDEDPYEVGPRISYNRFIGGDKKKEAKKKKNINRVQNPLVTTKPVYLSKKITLAKANAGYRKCSDGSLPLDGFILGNEDETSFLASLKKYYPPEVPKDWKSSKQIKPHLPNTNYMSTSDAARASKLDPRSRALALGESILPGKSVFDYLSVAARDRLAAASGKDNLPMALGQIPKEYKATKDDREAELMNQIPMVDKLIADAALSRGANGFMPYSDDEPKRKRYCAYLEYQSGIRTEPPSKESKVSDGDWLKELDEFARCAQIFKPMSGSMATRFTHSTNNSQISTSNPIDDSKSILLKPNPKVEDPAEQAAKLSMYGPMTRSSKIWYPSRLLCKRFNINPPAHVQPGNLNQTDNNISQDVSPKLVSKHALDTMMQDTYSAQQGLGVSIEVMSEVNNIYKKEDINKIQVDDIIVDSQKNEALEGQKAGEAVFRAIFGDDSDEE